MPALGKFRDGSPCSHIRDLEVFLDDPRFKILVIGQKWGNYRDEMLRDGWKSYENFIRSFLAEHKNRKVYVLLDNAWDESEDTQFDIKRRISNRFLYEKTQS